MNEGASINYVSKILPIFDPPSPLRRKLTGLSTEIVTFSVNTYSVTILVDYPVYLYVVALAFG